MNADLTEADSILEQIKTQFPEAVLEASAQRDRRIVIAVARDSLVDVARYLRDKMGFDHPASVTGVDQPARKELDVIYHIWSTLKKILVGLKVTTPADQPRIHSLAQVWTGVTFHERETHEMLGIEFVGHPKLGNLLLQEDWEGGPPLRRQFKLRTTLQ